MTNVPETGFLDGSLIGDLLFIIFRVIENLHISAPVPSSTEDWENLVIREFVCTHTQSPTRTNSAPDEVGDRFGCAARQPCERCWTNFFGPFIAEPPRVLLRRSGAAVEMHMMRSAVFALGADINRHFF